MNKTRLEYSAPTGLKINKTSADVSVLKKAEWCFNRKHITLPYMEDDNPPCKLTYDDDDNDWSVPVLERDSGKPTFINLNSAHHDLTVLAGIDEELTPLKPSPPCISQVDHPEFSEEIRINTSDDMAEFWGGKNQDSEETNYWLASAAKRERDRLKLENRVHLYCDDPELLLWAGIISKEESEKMECAHPDLDILHTLMNDEEFPEMELMFFEGRLCINEVPTIIREDDLRDLYNGHAAFNGSEEAEKVVISTIKKLLMELFRKE
jgi:hypothetical protein